MNPQDAISILQEHADALRARGVRHAALFGSVVRGEADLKSDLDVLIELDPSLRLNAFDYAGLKQYIADLFPGRVDVVNKAFLKPHVLPSASAEALYAF
jgi:predicted nucleotidyltransferase